MNNVLMILVGVVTVVFAMACANSVEMFRATVCVSLLVLNVCMISLVSMAIFEVTDDDDDEKPEK